MGEIAMQKKDVFLQYIHSKTKTKDLLLSGEKILLEMVSKKFIPFLLFFTRSVSLNQLAKKPQRQGKRTQDRTITQIKYFKPAELEQIPFRILRVQNKDILESLATIFENLWRTDELLKELKRTDVMFIFKSREQKKSGNYILFCLSS